MTYRLINERQPCPTHLVVPFKAEKVLDEMRQQSFEFEPLQTSFYTQISHLFSTMCLSVFKLLSVKMSFMGTQLHQVEQWPKLTSLYNFPTTHFYKSHSLCVIPSCLHRKIFLSIKTQEASIFPNERKEH